MTYFAMLRQLFIVQVASHLIEASGDVFKFHPSSSGYVIHGLFEVPSENFVGNQFWLCFDYNAEDVRPKRSFGRYLRSVAQETNVEDEEVLGAQANADFPKPYPSLQCGGSMDEKSNFWFALNGVWVGERRLQLQVVSMRSQTRVLSHALNLESDLGKLAWKLGVSFMGTRPSIVRFTDKTEFEIPAMEKNSQAQIRLDGFGAQFDTLVSNHETIVFPVLLPPGVQRFDPNAFNF